MYCTVNFYYCIALPIIHTVLKNQACNVFKYCSYDKNLRVLTNLTALIWFFFLQIILLRSTKRMTLMKSRKQIILLMLRNHLFAFYQRSRDLFHWPIIVGILCQMLLDLVKVMLQPHLCHQPACSLTWWYVLTSFFFIKFIYSEKVTKTMTKSWKNWR